MLAANQPRPLSVDRAAQDAQSEQQQQRQQNTGEQQEAPRTPRSAEQKRTSLLDVLRHKLPHKGEDPLVYRLMVCGELVTENVAHRQDVGVYYQKFFQDYQAENKSVTGLLLVYNKAFVHLVEGTLKVIQAFTRNLLQQMQQDKTAMFRNVRVLTSDSDIPQRSFPMWASRVVEMRSMDAVGDLDPSSFSSERILHLVTECADSMSKLSQTLAKTQHLDMKAAIDELYEEHKNLLPRQEVLGALANTQELMSMEEWLQLYDSHTELVLDGDLVWPVPRAIIYN